jgi:hypothetical protein
MIILVMVIVSFAGKRYGKDLLVGKGFYRLPAIKIPARSSSGILAWVIRNPGDYFIAYCISAI